MTIILFVYFNYSRLCIKIFMSETGNTGMLKCDVVDIVLNIRL